MFELEERRRKWFKIESRRNAMIREGKIRRMTIRKELSSWKNKRIGSIGGTN